MMIRADIKCYYCGHISGQIEGDPTISRPQWSFRSRNGQLLSSGLSRSRRIRCARCEGPVFLDEIESIRPQRELQADLAG